MVDITYIHFKYTKDVRKSLCSNKLEKYMSVFVVV